MTSSVGMMTFQTEWTNKKNVPKHQPITICPLWWTCVGAFAIETFFFMGSLHIGDTVFHVPPKRCFLEAAIQIETHIHLTMYLLSTPKSYVRMSAMCMNRWTITGLEHQSRLEMHLHSPHSSVKNEKSKILSRPCSVDMQYYNPNTYIIIRHRFPAITIYHLVILT